MKDPHRTLRWNEGSCNSWPWISYALTSFPTEYSWTIQPCPSFLRLVRCSSFSASARCLIFTSNEMEETHRFLLTLRMYLSLVPTGEQFSQEGQQRAQKEDSGAQIVFALPRQVSSLASLECPLSTYCYPKGHIGTKECCWKTTVWHYGWNGPGPATSMTWNTERRTDLGSKRRVHLAQLCKHTLRNNVNGSSTGRRALGGLLMK